MQPRALIVDDELQTCQFIEKALVSAGIEPLSITESTEAAGILSHGKFAVVFLDYHMACPDGLALARQIRDSGYNRMTPVILLSDDLRPGAVSEGFRAGASFFVYKPLDRDRLLRLIRATQGAIEVGLRRTRRVPLKSTVSLKIANHEFDVETVNISMEGMLVTAPRVLPVGSSVGIRLQMEEGMPPISGAGSIVRLHGKNAMGIHLGQLSPAESQRLQDLLLPLLPESPAAQ
jgi:CheY-like chemotaxis protein